ncbi:DNA-directed DNA polymerase [Serendipita sp. 401]|nr:DNA-directed DNA polymerase [Serendipita sp. 401]KAG9056477.1 DNA-directed DNA polymerase [Serendipita sp. 407]
MSSTLPLYWNLSSPVNEERLDASVQLIDALQKFQQSYVADRSQQVDPVGITESLDTINAQDVAYALKRLVRGLASPRESSRLGFAVALTELLHRIDTVSTAQMIDLVLSSSETTGSMSGQEERDMMFARLFGLSSIAQSGLLTRETPPPHISNPASTLQDYQRIITQLVILGDHKMWFRESCWWSISQVISVIIASNASFKSEALQWTVNELLIQDTSWTPEKIAIWLRYQSLWDNISQLPLKVLFKGKHPLTHGNLRHLSSILADINIEDEGISHGSSGTWKPNPHFVWSYLFDIYFPTDSISLGADVVPFQEFFRVVVDEQFFSSGASPERKYIGFQVVDSAVKRSPPSVLPHLFTQNFVRTWINQLAKRDRYLHKAAIKLASTVQDAVQKEPSSGFPLIIQLLGPNGSRDFDRLTNTKIVETILGYMEESQITEYVQYLIQTFSGKPNGSLVESDQNWVINQLSSLIRSMVVPKSDSWVTSILEFYVRNGFFTTLGKKKVTTFLPEVMRKSCRDKLLQALADLSSQATMQNTDAKTKKFNGKTTSGEQWVSVAVQIFRQLSKEKHVEALYETDDKFTEIRSRARSVIKSLGTIQGADQEAAQGGILLVAGLTLQTYLISTEEMDTDPLAATNETLRNVSSLFDLHSTKKKEDAPTSNGVTTMEVDPDEQKPFDLIVDDIIGYLEKPAPLMRAMAPQVFSAMCSKIEATTIELLIAQLQRRNVLSDEDTEDGESDASEEEHPSTEEEIEEDAGSTGDGTRSSLSEKSSSSSNGEDEEDKEDVDLEFRKRVAEALGANELNDSNSDSDASSELMMDDDQMMEIDAKLAEVFRSQSLSSKTKTANNLQREATHFKIRVLDLIEVFIRKQPQSSQLPSIVLPLMRVIIGCSSDEQQLIDKLNGIIRRRIGALYTIPNDANLDLLSADLEELHKIARKVSHQQVLPITLAVASIYLSKIFVDSGRTDIPARIYKESLADFMQRKGCKLHPTFFTESVKRIPLVVWVIRRELIQACESGKGVNTFRQMQAIHWVDTLLPMAPRLAGDDKREILSTIQLVRETVYRSLLDAVTGKHPLTISQAKVITKMALQALKITARTDEAEIGQIWDTRQFEHVFAEVSSSENLAKGGGLVSVMRQMATRLGTYTPESVKAKEKKRKVAEEKQAESPRKKVKKHQK